jgi:hypothetical protein
VTEAVGGGFIEQLRQLLADARVIGFGRQRAGAIRLAVALVGIDEIDVGAEVQFATPELAQPVHHQPLRLALAVADHAMTLGEFLLDRAQRALQAGFRQGRGTRERVAHRIHAQDIAPHQPCRFRRAITPQQRGPVGPVFRGQLRRRRRRRVGQQPGQQFGLAQHRLDREVAGQRDAAQAIAGLRIGQGRGAPGQVAQALQRAFGDGITGCVLHRAILACAKKMRPPEGGRMV